MWSGVKRLHDELGDNAGAIDALEAMARVEREMGTQPALAREHLEEALALAKELGEGKTVVTVAVDTGLKYLASDLYPM